MSWCNTLRIISKLFKYLKPYKFTLFIILLTFLVQQVCSLFLPTLMSNIVDVGIRQNGIENASPEAMPSKARDVLISFMLEDEKQFVNDAYWFMNYDTAKEVLGDMSADKMIKKINSLSDAYPLIKEESIYVLKDGSYKHREQLDKYFCNSISRMLKQLNKKSIARSYEHNFYDEFSDSTILSDIQLVGLDKKPLTEVDIYQEAASVNRQMYTELKMDISGNQSRYIMRIGRLMLLFTIISLLFTIIESYFSSKMSSGIMMKLREDVFKKVESFSESEFDKISESSLITRTISDVAQVKDTILMGLQILIPPIMLAGGITMAIQKSPSMSWTIFLGAIVSSAVIITVFILIFPKVELMQRLLDKFNLIVRERLSGMMVIKSLGNIGLEEQKFDETNKELSGVSSFVNRLLMYVSPFLTIVMNVTGIVIIWLGANQISQSSMQVGDLMAFMQYSSMVIGAFLMMVMMFSSLPHSFISINRVFEVLEMEPSIKDPESPRILSENFNAEICFKNVSFSYGKKDNLALKDINFTAKKGEIVSIIGATGSGKSTLVSLIPRFYDVVSGEILISGINIKDIAQSELREKVTFVPQKSILFTGNVKYNLRYGNPSASNEKIAKFEESDWLADIMENDGIKKGVSQEGKNFSGGQRQRICIARALIRNTPIYIFDDSFSALDFKTEALVRKGIIESAKDSLIILVSQRIGTIMNSDKIIVLDRGEIVGEGNHNSLMQTCPTYREIAESQIPEEVIL